MSSPCIWHGKIFYGKCYGLTFFYIWNWQSYKAYKKSCLKGFWENFYDNYNLLLSWLLLLLLKGQLNSSFLIRLRRDTIAHRLRFDQLSFFVLAKSGTLVSYWPVFEVYTKCCYMGKKAVPICVQQRNLLHQNQINNNYVPVLSKYRGYINNNNLYK